MDSQNIFPFLKESFINLYTERDESSPHGHNFSFEIHFNIILLPTLKHSLDRFFRWTSKWQSKFRKFLIVYIYSPVKFTRLRTSHSTLKKCWTRFTKKKKKKVYFLISVVFVF